MWQQVDRCTGSDADHVRSSAVSAMEWYCCWSFRQCLHAQPAWQTIRYRIAQQLCHCMAMQDMSMTCLLHVCTDVRPVQAAGRMLHRCYRLPCPPFQPCLVRAYSLPLHLQGKCTALCCTAPHPCLLHLPRQLSCPVCPPQQAAICIRSSRCLRDLAAHICHRSSCWPCCSTVQAHSMLLAAPGLPCTACKARMTAWPMVILLMPTNTHSV